MEESEKDGEKKAKEIRSEEEHPGDDDEPKKEEPVHHYANSLEALEEAIRHHEVETTTRFVYEKGNSAFSSDNVKILPDMKIYWDSECMIPYYKVGYRTYSCHQGKDKHVRYKEKYAVRRDNKTCEDHSFTKCYKQHQITKKLDCPASIRCTRQYILPSCKLKHNCTNYEKKKISCLIREKVSKGEALNGEVRFAFNLPPTSEHKNHVMGESAAVIEPMDRRVRNKVIKLVEEGHRSRAVITALLEEFVSNELKETDRTRRRFYPASRSIMSVIRSAKYCLRKSKIDQEGVEKLVANWDPETTFFHPCCTANDVEEVLSTDDENNDDDDDRLKWKTTTKNHLLFVYQNDNMKRLYRRYGQAIVLDATYRTCKYALPLYFLGVRTNINYQVVGVVITQYETTEALTEALQIIKKWNPDVTPKYGMVDYAHEEISALEEVFEDIKVFICSFHREQAWQRWSSKYRVQGILRNEMLGRLRAIAYAPNEEALQTALGNLIGWEGYSNELKLYFERTWKPEIKRWALAYKPLDLLFDTNNGVERLNEEFKYRHLDGYRNCLLSELIGVIVNKFLPERYVSYVEHNVRLTDRHRKYASNVPSYLRNRPKWLIEHILEKQAQAEEMNINGSNVSVITENTFSVSSSSGDDKLRYTVTFSKDSECSCACTCLSFLRTRLICKHAALISLKYPSFCFSKICRWLLDTNPLFTNDEELDILSQDYVNADIEQEEKSPMADTKDGSPTDLRQYCELPTRHSKKKTLLLKGNSVMRSLQSIMHVLEEDNLAKFVADLKETLQIYSSMVPCHEATGLPLRNDSVFHPAEMSTHKRYGKLQERLSGVQRQKRKVAAETLTSIIVQDNKVQIETEIVTETMHTVHPDLTTTAETASSNLSVLTELGKEDPVVQETGKDDQVQDFGKENEVQDMGKENQVQDNSSTEKVNRKRKRRTAYSLSPNVINDECRKAVELSDLVINAAQKILKRQEKAASGCGLQDSLFGQNLSFSVQKEGIQILHIKEARHWITIKIVDESTVELYDSLGMEPTRSLKRQIASIVHSDSKALRIVMKPVQMQQLGSNDCGVLAIAFATSLLRSEDPSTASFDNELLRPHLKLCLTNELFTSFPKTDKRLRRIRCKSFSISLFCMCRLPYFQEDCKTSKGIRMAECSECHEWYHQKCARIPEIIFKNTARQYHCSKCSSDRSPLAELKE